MLFRLLNVELLDVYLTLSSYSFTFLVGNPEVIIVFKYFGSWSS
jgi:hypothetical protein